MVGGLAVDQVETGAEGVGGKKAAAAECGRGGVVGRGRGGGGRGGEDGGEGGEGEESEDGGGEDLVGEEGAEACGRADGADSGHHTVRWRFLRTRSQTRYVWLFGIDEIVAVEIGNWKKWRVECEMGFYQLLLLLELCIVKSHDLEKGAFTAASYQGPEIVYLSSLIYIPW